MRRGISACSILLAALLGSSFPGAQTLRVNAANADLEKRFDAVIDVNEMGGWMKTMAAEPNHVGSAHDKANADMVLAQFKSWGWDARIETFQVLYPTPLSESLDLRVPAPGLELLEHHLGIRLVVRRTDVVGFGRHRLHPAAHLVRIDHRIEAPFEIRVRRVHCRGRGTERAGAQ